MSAPSSQTVIFLHIPKTAGTTLSEIFKANYHPAEIYNREFSGDDGASAFINLSVERRAAIRLLWGHFPFGLHQYLPGPFTYFTFLRDPVERVISHYYYLLSHPEMFTIPEIIREKNLTLHEVLERDLIVDIKNMYTRLLAGLPYLFPADGYTEEHGQTASQNLQNYFSVVGLVEKFDESLLLLKKAYGWDHIYYVPDNVNRQRPGRETIPPETIALIEQQNDMDMRLYRLGQELFAAQVARYGASFAQDVRQFQMRSRMWGAPKIKLKRRAHQSPTYLAIRKRLGQMVGEKIDAPSPDE